MSTIKLVFNDEHQTNITVEEGVSYSLQSLIPLLESQVEDQNVIDTYKYNLDACERGEKSALVDFQSTSIFSESLESGSVVGFAAVHKNGNWIKQYKIDYSYLTC